MRTKRVEFQPRGDRQLRLVGEIKGRPGHRPEGVVICHPHPEFGGNMDYPLVAVLADRLAAAGLVTLRFNFRGVGESRGHYGGGEGEEADTLGALDYLREQADFPVEEASLAGYSFGAWVGLRAAVEEQLPRALGICLPLSLFSFDFLRGYAGTLLLIHGTRDQFTLLEDVRGLADLLVNPVRLEVIAGGDHFLAGSEETVSRIAEEFFVSDEVDRKA